MNNVVIGIFIVVFLLINYFISDMVLHKEAAGAFPAFILAIWCVWPFFHNLLVRRFSFLHPVPREYIVSTKVAFAKVREILADVTYNFGDKWQVVTADTQAGRIAANLRFTDEHTHFNADARGHIHTRKERRQRFIALDVQVKDSGHGTALVKLDFSPKIEGSNFFACDSIVSKIGDSVETALGPGKRIRSSKCHRYCCSSLVANCVLTPWASCIFRHSYEGGVQNDRDTRLLI